jgi:uroporphyrinogen-III synthase
VLDLTAYRVVPVPDLRRTLERSSRTADLMLATSPSALSALRRGLAPAAFRRLRRRPTLVVLGARSARAARGHGFRGVRIVPSLSPAGIARYLAREVVRGR